MKFSFRKPVACMLGAVMLLSVSGCCKDEPAIIVPEPESAAPIVKGTVITNNGAVLEGAAVTITGDKTYSVITDTEGNYSVTVEPGIYAISAQKEGYSGRTDAVTAENDVVTIWNALLSQPIAVSGEITSGEDTYIEVPVPPLVQEASTGDEMMTAYIPSETTEGDDALMMVFYYDASFVEETKSFSRLMRLINVNYYLSSGNELKQPITITVSTPAEPAYVKLNDHAVEYTFDSGKAEVRIVTQELGWLTFDYNVTISELYYGTENVTFEQSVYDNFYGSAPMHIVNPRYSYYTGGTLSGNHVLINSLAASYTNLVKKASQTAEYPLDITLPVGGKMKLSGSQELYATEFDVADGLMHSTVVQYLGPVITAETYNRQHTGGSN